MFRILVIGAEARSGNIPVPKCFLSHHIDSKLFDEASTFELGDLFDAPYN